MADQQNKTVIVTGGTRGIGFAIVHTLLDKGYDVAFTGRSSASIREASARFAELKLHPRGRVLDLSKRASIRNFGKNTQTFYGLVNCAGVCDTAYLGEDGDSWLSVWDHVIRTNLDGTAYLTHVLCGALSEPGRIVNIGSQLGMIGRAEYSAYCASKFALIGLTQVWSRELGHRDDVTVNAVCPGWIETEMTERSLTADASMLRISEQQLRKDIEVRLDQRRFNTPEEVANIVAFLLSPEASGITGRCMEMAGPSA